MSDAREWLNAAVVTDPATTVACQNALLAVLDECDEINYQFGPDVASSLSGYPDGAVLAACLVQNAINKALGISDE